MEFFSAILCKSSTYIFSSGMLSREELDNFWSPGEETVEGAESTPSEEVSES